MRSLKTFCAATLLLLALSVNTHAGDMECGIFTPPPPPPATTASDASQDSTDAEDDGLLDSLFDWFFDLTA